MEEIEAAYGKNFNMVRLDIDALRQGNSLVLV
jgi:hypothetical protein